MVVMTPRVAVITSSASTSPLTARNPAVGLSASRRTAIRVAGRWVRRASRVAPHIVSHGPDSTRPSVISRNEDRYPLICPGTDSGCQIRNAASSTSPATSGTTRHARGGAGVTRRVTPSGEICTRRSAIRAATAAASGTPTATPRI